MGASIPCLPARQKIEMNTQLRLPAAGRPNRWRIRAERWKAPDEFFDARQLVVHVVAPAGYGKSTLLDAWRDEALLRDVRTVCARVQMDDADGERLMLDLLTQVAVADEERSRMLGGGMGAETRRAAEHALVAGLRRSRRRTVVIIDDAHFLTDVAGMALLDMLVRQQPDHVTLVVSSRTPFERLLAQALLSGRCVRIGAEELAFRPAEIEELIAQHGLAGNHGLAARIRERTGGWPAVIRLLAITLSASPNPEALLGAQLDSKDALFAYLSETLLTSLPQRTADFLLWLALLRCFSVALATGVSGMADGETLLQDLRDCAIPIAPSGDPELPLQIHALVREFLLLHFARKDPDGMAEAASRAQHWLIAHGRCDVAIDLRLDIGDQDEAAVLLDRFARGSMRHYGTHLTYLRWCNRLEAEQRRRFPRVQALRAWSLNILRRFDEADAVIDELDAQPDLDAATVRLVELEHCIALVVRDHWLPLAERSRAWVARWGACCDPLDLGMAQVMIGCGAMATSRFEVAETVIAAGSRLIVQSQAHYCLVWARMWLATVQIKNGRYRQALKTCDEAIARATAALGSQTPSKMMIEALRALVLYEQDRISEAAEALDMGLTNLVEQSSVDGMIAGYTALSRIMTARGQFVEASAILAEGEALGWQNALPRIAVALAAERTDLLLRHARISQARLVWIELTRRVERLPLDDIETDIARRVLADKTGRIEARLALVNRDARRASEQITDSLLRARSSGQQHKVVENLLLLCRARLLLADRSGAEMALSEAVDIGMVEGYVRVLADSGAEIIDLLAARLEHEESSTTRQYLSTLLAAAGGAASGGRHEAPGGLTRQEHKVLVQLASGLNNRELASTLFISEGTLKWHLKNIYSKLGVSNRLSAVNAAKKLGMMIQPQSAQRRPT